jgi:hypothetical protein
VHRLARFIGIPAVLLMAAGTVGAASASTCVSWTGVPPANPTTNRDSLAAAGWPSPAVRPSGHGRFYEVQAKVLLAGLVAPDVHVTRGAVETQGIPQSRREAFTPVTLPAREREELELSAAHGLTGDTSDTGSALDILTRLHDGTTSPRACTPPCSCSFLTDSQASSGPTLERRSPCTPSGQKLRARQEPARAGREPSPATCEAGTIQRPHLSYPYHRRERRRRRRAGWHGARFGGGRAVPGWPGSSPTW